MDSLIKYLESGHSLSELFAVMLIIAGVIVCIEKTIKWIYDLFLKLYKRKKGEEDEVATLDKNTSEIKKLSENIDNLNIFLNQQYQRLDEKIDEQHKRLTQIDTDGKRRDCAVLRDRILSGMRYFSQNVDENGVVHIAMTDYENMNEMFTEYFKCNGNGVCHSLYENEFKKFKIDTERKF